MESFSSFPPPTWTPTMTFHYTEQLTAAGVWGLCILCCTMLCCTVLYCTDIVCRVGGHIKQKSMYNQWTRTKVSSSSSPPKNSQNLRNPLWRALASKPLNRLSSVTPFYKWEAMSFHHILLDLVSDFGKGPKRGL